MPKKITITPKSQLKADDQVDMFVAAAEPGERSAQGAPSTGPMKRLTVDIPADLHRRLKAGCAERGIQMADAIRDLLEANF